MNRSDYLETEKGQRHERQKRYRKRQRFLVSGHEPKSKNAMKKKKEEKVQFQRTILSQMRKNCRRAYRSPVVLEIDFYSCKNDPPAIHTLAKNYMDLLQKPVDGSGINRTRILLSDDRQIAILIVNYHLREENKPKIEIQVDTLANFTKDMALLERIRQCNFQSEPTYDINSVYGKNNVEHRIDRFREAIQELREYESQHESIKLILGKETFEGMRRVYLMEAQKYYIDAFEPKMHEQFCLFEPRTSSGSNIERLYRKMRNNIIAPPFMIDLTHAPVTGNGQVVFKKNVEKALAEFKTKHPLLFPLLHTMGVIILCVPPKSHSAEGKEQYVDLDNLARYVVPKIHEELKPPADTVHTFDVTTIDDEYWRRIIEERLEKLKRTPECSVTQYQIIRLPRFEDDPDNGFVSLALCSGKPYESMWYSMDEIIKRWEEN